MVGTGWSLRGLKPRHEARLQAKTLPNTGEAFSKAGNWDGTLGAGIDQGWSRQEMGKNASMELFWKGPSGLRAGWASAGSIGGGPPPPRAERSAWVSSTQ